MRGDSEMTDGMAAALDVSDATEALDEARRCYHAGQLEQAESICRRVLEAHPNHPRALHRLGKIAMRAGAPGMAVAFATKAIAQDASVPAFHGAHGNALRSQGKPAEAEAAQRRALALDPTSVRAHIDLSVALRDQGRLAEALDVLNHAAELDPRNAATHHAVAVHHTIMGQTDDALASFRRAMELQPALADPHAGLIFAQHYSPTADPAALEAEARVWGERYAEPLAAQVRSHGNVPDPDRRLRVGYISGDFRGHPVGRIIQSVLSAHDKAQVEVFCYTNHWARDGVTARLRAAADHWRTVYHLNDESLAEMIRDDEIDILVDLSGHTAENRLLALARKPAPVQALWLGYFDTTGMAAIDYIIADRFVCLKGDERFFVERVARLPHSFLCYTPPDSSPDVEPPPALSRGHVTFGCFNNCTKVTPEVVALWADILRGVPSAMMCLKSVPFADAAVRARYADLFRASGISPDRLDFQGPSPYGEHLATHRWIDIALDPFPYNGGHTTLDALWMGVPVLTLAGDRFVGRMGVSVLSTLGLAELIAGSPAEYVEKAIALVGDLDRLAALRAGLRPRMAASPLLGGPDFARGLEIAYRQMWRSWCQSRASEPCQGAGHDDRGLVQVPTLAGSASS